MLRVADYASVPSWMVVLPDCASAASVAKTVQSLATQRLSHPSGRPWMLGRWTDGAVCTGEAGPVRVAVVGDHDATPDRLAAEATRMRGLSDVDRLTRSVAGMYHLVASVNGRVRVQGNVTGVRRVFHATVGDTAVAADRADVLAWLLDARLDERRLAVQMLLPSPPELLARESPWHGVSLLAPDRYLTLDEGSRRRAVKWWSPPEPRVPMNEGAVALRDALAEAVAVRVGDRQLVSCDLGGLDSTSVCCAAARTGTPVVAYTAESRDPLAEDEAWAVRTVAGLGEAVEHHLIPAHEIPLMYHDVGTVADPLDEPCAAAIDRERWLVIARRAAARGSTMHLTGIGGDELLYGAPAHLHAVLRRDPRTAMRNLRGFAAKYRWPRRQMMAQLLDNRSYADWLRGIADDLVGPPPPRQEPQLHWGFGIRMPPWATTGAVEAAGELIRQEAGTAEPLAQGRGQHVELEMMQFSSRVTRLLGQMSERLGVTTAAPYYDQRVIEAGLAVRPEDRITPWQYKPLIIEAMRGIVPEESLTRQTSDDGSCDEEPGLRHNRPGLLALCDDSRLDALGLIDAQALRAAVSRPMATDLHDAGILRQTVAVEGWLRSLEADPVAA